MILNQLGIFGWKEADENLVLASLLTGDPLLLIGNHGCAKTPCGALGNAFANKVAQALGRRVPRTGQKSVGQYGVVRRVQSYVRMTWRHDGCRRLSQRGEAQAGCCGVRVEPRDHLGQGTRAYRRTQPRGAGAPEQKAGNHPEPQDHGLPDPGRQGLCQSTGCLLTI